MKISVKEKYSISKIDRQQYKYWLLNKHYAKRMPLVEYAFGLFESNKLVGVVTYGTPFSPQLRGLFKDKYKMMELNRLVVNDGIDKNALSYFVSTTLQKLPKPLVVISFADTAQNHNGYIYQATNFIYTGLSAKRKNWKIRGLEHKHSVTIADKSKGSESRADFMRQKYGDDFYMEDRSRKHRYFYFTGSKRDVKNMLQMLPYKIEKYPKGENKRYELGEAPPHYTQNKMF